MAFYPTLYTNSFLLQDYVICFQSEIHNLKSQIEGFRLLPFVLYSGSLPYTFYPTPYTMSFLLRFYVLYTKFRLPHSPFPGPDLFYVVRL